MAQVIGLVNEPSGIHIERPDIGYGRIDAKHMKAEATRAVLYGGVYLSHAGKMPSQRNDVADDLDIVVGKTNRGSCFISSCLLRGPAGIHSDGGCPVGIPNIVNGASESLAIGQQENHGGDAPGHT